MYTNLFADTSKAWAVHPHRTADPWPDMGLYKAQIWAKIEVNMYQRLSELEWAKKPRRPFPITVYYTACQVPGKNFCRLATIPDYVATLARSPIYDQPRRVRVAPVDRRGPVLKWAHRLLSIVL